jgi:hypothetical protein
VVVDKTIRDRRRKSEERGSHLRHLDRNRGTPAGDFNRVMLRPLLLLALLLARPKRIEERRRVSFTGFPDPGLLTAGSRTQHCA